MKTAVLMKRELFGREINQNSKTEMLSATDLVKAGNMYRASLGMDTFSLTTWLSSKNTKEFIAELEARYGSENIRKMSRGKGSHTWFHPLLFIDLALSINPSFKVEVYEWLFDNLIKVRDDSGNSYKKMCGSLYVRATNKTFFPKFVANTALSIQRACGLKDSEDWQNVTEDKLLLRDTIHKNIALLADVLNNNDEAVRLGILKSLED